MATGLIDKNGNAIVVNVDGSINAVISGYAKDGFTNLSVALPSITRQTTPLNSTSVALEASRQVKATSGVLFGFSGYNSKSTAQFILMFDAAGGVPTNGSIPVGAPITVGGSSNFSYDPGRYGRAFTNGIWLVNSSTANTLTIGSADCWFDAQVA